MLNTSHLAFIRFTFHWSLHSSIKNIRNMHAVSINQIAYILHFKDNNNLQKQPSSVFYKKSYSWKLCEIHEKTSFATFSFLIKLQACLESWKLCKIHKKSPLPVSFLIKLRASQETLTQVFSSEFFETFKNTFFTEHHPAIVFEFITVTLYIWTLYSYVAQ